jgi:hypothetical protein
MVDDQAERRRYRAAAPLLALVGDLADPLAMAAIEGRR